jgi:hypothetical protein
MSTLVDAPVNIVVSRLVKPMDMTVPDFSNFKVARIKEGIRKIQWDGFYRHKICVVRRSVHATGKRRNEGKSKAYIEYHICSLSSKETESIPLIEASSFAEGCKMLKELSPKAFVSLILLGCISQKDCGETLISWLGDVRTGASKKDYYG